MLTVTRRPARADAVIGELGIDGVYQCFTLERASTLIPAGTYPVKLTVSSRAGRGQLWTPDSDKRLLLIDEVQGRSGIRIHAANTPEQLEGCTAVGFGCRETTVTQSRLALEAVMTIVTAELMAGKPVRITYLNHTSAD